MKQNLLVTLADKNFIQQAKQLFSSVYWNAGWEGDYMLLSHEIPEEELKWFRDKGILIKKCKPLRNALISSMQMDYTPVVLDKFQIFSVEFKKWGTIIFIDSDIIVRSSLEKLTKIRGFGATVSTLNLAQQFSTKKNHLNELEKRYNLHKMSFSTAIMAFSTDIIHDDTQKILTDLFEKYESITLCSEESILNLLFYKDWIRIPRVFNFVISEFMMLKLKYAKVQAIVLHFMRVIGHDKFRPWNSENPFYAEWNSNLEKAELIDLKHTQKAKKWNIFKIKYYSLRISIIDVYNKLSSSAFRYRLESFFRYKLRSFFIYTLKYFVIYLIKTPDRFIGRFGTSLKKHYPNLYYKLKK